MIERALACQGVTWRRSRLGLHDCSCKVKQGKTKKAKASDAAKTTADRVAVDAGRHGGTGEARTLARPPARARRHACAHASARAYGHARAGASCRRGEQADHDTQRPDRVCDRCGLQRLSSGARDVRPSLPTAARHRVAARHAAISRRRAGRTTVAVCTPFASTTRKTASPSRGSTRPVCTRARRSGRPAPRRKTRRNGTRACALARRHVRVRERARSRGHARTDRHTRAGGC